MGVPGMPHPIRLRPATTDWVVMEQIFIDQAFSLSQWPDHERAIRACYDSAIKRGHTPVIVDCGAHIGLGHAMVRGKVSRCSGVRDRTRARNYEILRWNVQPYPNITPIHAAVWDHESPSRLLNAGAEPWAWETKETGSEGVPTVTIPGLLSGQPDSALLIARLTSRAARLRCSVPIWNGSSKRR